VIFNISFVLISSKLSLLIVRGS